MEEMNSDANNELVCVMASLGYYDDEEYYMGTDCIESLKDCIRFLRKEDENCNIRRQMGAAHLLQKDLLPMLVHLGEKEELADIVIRLVVNLTSPADICFNKLEAEGEAVEDGRKSKEKVTNTYQTKYNEVVGYLQTYKKAFTERRAMGAIGAQLGRILKMEYEDRREDDYLLFERLLLLLRNILHVPVCPEDEMRTDDDASLHDQVLLNMHLNGIDDLIIYVCSTPEEARWTMHVMEIISLMFREQNPEILAKSSEESSEKEKVEVTRDLMNAKKKEEVIRKAQMKKTATSRHSRFGGTFWVQNMKGVGQQNTLVHHKLVADPNDITFDDKKFPVRVPKRKRPLEESETEKRSTLKIRLFLKEFCKKFLEHAYNPMMRQLKDTVLAKRTQENDDTYYIWGTRFFMMFNRAHSFKVEYVSETLNMNAFHYILKQINTYYDQFIMCKRGGWEPWAIRLHKAMQTYKELLTHISNMDVSHDSVLKEASNVIKSSLFYHEEYRTVFLVLLRHYDVGRHSRKFLIDLIDTFHIFLKLLEKFCKHKGSLLVKTKKKAPKKRKKASSAHSGVSAMTPEQLDEIWENDLAPALSGYLQGYETFPEDIPSPFDYESDVPVDEQRSNAMIRIQDFLRSGESGNAVALIRASRECWPEESQFGAENMAPEDEFGLFRNILTMELERPAFDQQVEEEEEEEENEEEEEESASVRSVEREFHLKSFLISLVSAHLMIPYGIQLKRFKTNSPFTNHALVKMMYRIAFDMKFPEMFYQVSFFLIFKEVLELVDLEQFKELQKFARYIIYRFTDAAIENPNIYVEALFLKGTGDCYQISSREPEKSESAKSKWSIDEEIELKTLYDEYKDREDIVGDIINNMKDPSGRTRKKVINKLVSLQCVESANDLPNPDKAAGNWTYEQEEELKSLFEEHRNSEDVVGEILKHISDQDWTRRKITNKLVRLKMVENAKDLPKPPKPPKPSGHTWTEEQTEELHRLYDEYKATGDVLLNIMVTMTFKKSKRAIRKQLIESGKVMHKSDLGKSGEGKKKKKTEKTFKDMARRQDDEPIYDDWSDEEVAEPSPKRTSNTNNDNRENKGSDDSSDDSDDDDDMISLSIGKLVRMVRQEYSQQLIWLQTRLKRAAEDREEDSDWYAMPLLTITEDDDLAMQNKDFKKLLLAMGLRPPVDEQEMFWRIDEKLTPQKLRRLANDLENPGESTNDPAPSDEAVSSKDSANVDENANETVTRKPKKKRRLMRTDSMSSVSSSSGSDSDDDGGGGSNKNDGKKVDEEEREEDDAIQQKKAKRKRIVLDDDDSDDVDDDDDDDDDDKMVIDDEGTTESVNDNIPLHQLLDDDDDVSNTPKDSDTDGDTIEAVSDADTVKVMSDADTIDNIDNNGVSSEKAPTEVLRDATNLVK